MSEPTAFHLALEAARESAGISIAKACDVIGISVGTWTYWKQHEPVYGKQKRALNRLAEVTAEPEFVGVKPTIVGDKPSDIPPVVKALVKAVGGREESVTFVSDSPEFMEHVRQKPATVASISAPMSQGHIPPVEVPDQRAATTKPEPQYVRFNP